MIKINNISPSSRFPLIEFEFENVTEEQIALKEFEINVLDIEIDKTPFLEFRFDIRDDSNKDFFWSKKGDLEIYVKNNGFGAITFGYIEIDGPILNELIPLQFRCSTTFIWKLVRR